MCGHKVEIVPRGRETSPDLRLQSIGGAQEWLYVECYQPNQLSGKPSKISEDTLDGVVKRSMAKARRKFEKSHPGIMAVFARALISNLSSTP
jgi:hypothetical protein